MSLAALKRWHWVVVAVVAGVLAGTAFQEWTAEPYGPVVSGLGFQLTDAARFESAVKGELAGQRLFKELVIHPRWTMDGPGRSVPVDVVSGLYCDGRVTGTGGDATAVWRPTCFVAPRPYRPATAVAGFRADGTVADYLAGLPGVRFSTTWWEAYPYLTAMTMSLVLIGGVWPTAVNLMAFGSVTRPPQAKALSLWSVKNRHPPAATRPAHFAAEPGDPDAAVGDRSEPAPESAAGEPEPAPLQLLVAEPLSAAAERERAAAEYAKRADDYYPTAKRGD